MEQSSGICRVLRGNTARSWACLLNAGCLGQILILGDEGVDEPVTEPGSHRPQRLHKWRHHRVHRALQAPFSASGRQSDRQETGDRSITEPSRRSTIQRWTDTALLVSAQHRARHLVLLQACKGLCPRIVQRLFTDVVPPAEELAMGQALSSEAGNRCRRSSQGTSARQP